MSAPDERCIECEEIELARVRDVRAGQTLPIPYAALDGFPAGRSPSDLTRRRLLQWGVAGFASVYAAKTLGFEEVWESVAAASEAEEQNALVLIYLAGGNDGLNVVVPNGAGDASALAHYDAYRDARPALSRGVGPTPAGGRVGSRALTGPGGAAQMAFSNAVVSSAAGGDNGDAKYGLDVLYGDGNPDGTSKLAVMPAVDAIPYNLSHFDNADIWFEASHDLNTKTGWLGRWIDRNGSSTNPLQAISIDNALSKSIRTSVNPVCAISSMPSTGFRLDCSGYGGGTNLDMNLALRDLAGVQAGASNAYLKRSRSTYELAYNTWFEVKDAGPIPAPTVTGITYPNGTLSTRLRTAAHLLGSSLGTRVITIHWGGFDTHTNQVKSQDGQMKEFSRALAAFQAELEFRKIDHRVATLVFSEFGRRVKETPNSTAEATDAGTDHGAGGLMFAMGSKVRGGLASEWPGCRPNDLEPIYPVGNVNYGKLHPQGNIKVPTDFRSVYRGVIAEWLGDQDPDSLIGGKPIPTLVRGDGQGSRLFRT